MRRFKTLLILPVIGYTNGGIEYIRLLSDLTD